MALSRPNLATPFAGLLTSGILPAMRHCIQHLMADDMIVLPAAATVYCQAAEARTGTVCGFDMSAANRYRWHPAHTSGMSPRYCLWAYHARAVAKHIPFYK